MWGIGRCAVREFLSCFGSILDRDLNLLKNILWYWLGKGLNFLINPCDRTLRWNSNPLEKRACGLLVALISSNVSSMFMWMKWTKLVVRLWWEQLFIVNSATAGRTCYFSHLDWQCADRDKIYFRSWRKRQLCQHEIEVFKVWNGNVLWSLTWLRLLNDSHVSKREKNK